MADVNRRWLLKSRPVGTLEDTDLDFVKEPVPEPTEGEILVRVQMLSCDPTQRGWLGGDTYLPAVKIGEVVRSLGAGKVIKSRHPEFREGDLVAGLVGWQDYAAINPVGMTGMTKLPPGTPLDKALGTLGLNGLTAYFGLLDIGRPQPGETVVVSGAAGATGWFCQSSRLQVVAGARPDGGMRSGVRKQAEDFDSTAELAQPPSISADLLIMPGTNA